MIQQVDTALYNKLDAKFELALMQCTDARLQEQRKEAFEIFKKEGFPTVKNEEWKNTPINAYLKPDYDLNVVHYDISQEQFSTATTLLAKHSEEIQQQIKGEQKGAYRLVIVNGNIDYKHSFLPKEDTLKVLPFEKACGNPSFKKFFGTIATPQHHSFTALNTALFTDGLFIEIAKGTILDKPLHIIHTLLAENPIWLQPRNLYVINENASLDIIETIITDGQEQPIFTNSVTEIVVGNNAHFNHYDIQNAAAQNLYFVNRTEAIQEHDSNYSNYSFTFPGASLVRNNLTIHHQAPGLESHLYGLYLTADKQLVDNHTEIHHKHPNGESNQLYKGILLDESRAVFNGKIYVYEDAQKTNAFQQSSNLLFSNKAVVNAKPQLEIFADDVKCSHGTTIGQMDKEALFYLQSRGIGELSAKTMMMQAFAFDVTEKVKNTTLRNYLEKEIQKIMKA